MRIFLILGLLMLAGCGAPAGQTSLYSWKDDGNPLVQPCKATLIDCKSAIQFQDMTTGSITTLPLTATSWVAPDSKHVYEARTIGYDGDGRPLASPLEVAPHGIVGTVTGLRVGE